MSASPAPPSPSGSVDRKKEVRKVILSSYVGTTIEYYDFLLYTSAASLVFAKVFFSNAPASVGTILSFVTLLAGYLARPIGGIIFGHFGDRLGRKRMLLITMAIMGVASTLIGVVPSYDTIGVWAPILLVTLRVAQGIAVGGDWGGSATISVEASEEGKRGLTAAFVNMGAPSGAVIATLVLAGFGLMSDEAFLSWGWRIPFLLSAVLVIIGLKIRSSMSESPLFAEMQAKADEQEKKEVPLVAVLKNHWRAVLLAAFGTLAAFALQGLLASYALTLGVSSGGHSRTAVLVAFAVGSVLQIGGLGFYANLSDRYGRRPVMMFGAVLGIVLVLPDLLDDRAGLHAPAVPRHDHRDAARAVRDLRPVGGVHLRDVQHRVPVHRRLARLPDRLNPRRRRIPAHRSQPRRRRRFPAGHDLPHGHLRGRPGNHLDLQGKRQDQPPRTGRGSRRGPSGGARETRMTWNSSRRRHPGLRNQDAAAAAATPLHGRPAAIGNGPGHDSRT